ncbi:hypothetical protein OVY29_20780 [Sphingopyxis sp. SE2]|uniref:hypothetical protein n=1 Tax=Sphingopyxis sp. SE2 TaxID=1586240 RepID=UPI0028C06A83|nr:hypothetical protein [Sphingopyxis sp. SE2]MDT7531103.1 hypothetical protein [Sphingopyxis sp. SE2]
MQRSSEDLVKSQMMANAVTQVLTTVNAPYGAAVSAHQLAAMIVDSQSAIDFNAPVFAFFSEVPLQVQKQFMTAMGVNAGLASQVAEQVSELSGYALPLAA